MLENKIKNDILNGAFAGYLSVFLTQPLQVIRTSMMVTYDNKKTLGMNEAYKKIYKEEGVKGFYRGLIPAMVKATLGSAVFFGCLEVFKKAHLKQEICVNHHLINFNSAGVARIIQSIIMNPLVVIKTRFEVVGFKEYTSLRQALYRLHLDEGIRGYFIGLKASLAKDVPSTASFYVLYESIKTCFKMFGMHNIQIQALGASFIATVVLCVLNNPLDVIKTRLQYLHFSKNENHHYNSLIKGVIQIGKTEGIRGLCSGIVPKLIKKSMSSVLVWTLYESMKN